MTATPDTDQAPEAPVEDTPIDETVEDTTDRTLVPIPQPRVARRAEGKAWEATNSDGSLNPGSFQSLAGIASVELAHELITAAQRAADPTNTDLPAMNRVMWLARRLLHAADTVQARMRADGCVDRGDNSHSRARGAIRFAAEALPMSLEATVDERADWIAALIERATRICLLGVNLAAEPVLHEPF